MIDKICGRCKSKIECNADGIAKCICAKIQIQQETLVFLKKTKYDCLCNKCLNELNDLVMKSKQSEFPKFSSQYKKDLHYYIDQDFYVFTEIYLIQRGSCCENGCRHCPYGYNLK